MSADLIIRGGTVIDGTGAPGRQADIAVTGDRISAIGDKLDGKRTLDAGGHVLSPGFIDIHTHYDAQVFWDPALTPSSWHGVTSVVAGNCGFSIAPCHPEHPALMVHELEVIMAALGQAGRGVVELLPGEKIKHKDVYALQRKIGVPFTWTALLTVKGYPWHEGMAELNSKERATGADVWPQVSVRPLVFSMNMAEP